MTTHGHEEDAACAVAHGAHSHEHGTGERTLVAVFASPVAGYLLRYGADLGYTGLLLEPDGARASAASVLGFPVLAEVPSDLDDAADVVLTDHHRDELGVMLRDALATKARWIGIMGNPRHAGPHVAALTELGVAPAEIARVHRPIGLNIGSRTPPEIAIATLAGLLADRNGRPGGLEFLSTGCALTRSSGLNCAIDTVRAVRAVGAVVVRAVAVRVVRARRAPARWSHSLAAANPGQLIDDVYVRHRQACCNDMSTSDRNAGRFGIAYPAGAGQSGGTRHYYLSSRVNRKCRDDKEATHAHDPSGCRCRGSIHADAYRGGVQQQ